MVLPLGGEVAREAKAGEKGVELRDDGSSVGCVGHGGTLHDGGCPPLPDLLGSARPDLRTRGGVSNDVRSGEQQVACNLEPVTNLKCVVSLELVRCRAVQVRVLST